MTQFNLSTISAPVHIDFLPDGKTPIISSLQLAEHFGIKHAHVLRDIRAILIKVPEFFSQSNFGFAEYMDEQNKPRPFYNLTRDGFTLLAMGYNSPKAIQWKIRYIQAFNALEAAVMENIRQEALSEGSKAALEKMHVENRACFTPERLQKIRKALYYRQKDLTISEIAKLLDCSRSSARECLRVARLLGLEAV